MKFDDSIPIYLQIKEEIENAILIGALMEENVVPSIRILAQQYRLNPQTIANAFNELINEGLLYKKRGIGMFVERDAKKKLKDKKMSEFRNVELEKVIRQGKTLGVKKEEILKTVEEIYQEGETK
jgi:DNA-binding transcriptional regulator YhcF (GntR family)